MILITPDAQRTMNTFLGASIDLSPDDIDAAAVARAEIVYLEGYLWDQPRAKDAMRKAMRLAHERSEEHTSELQSLMRISYAVFCLKKKTHTKHTTQATPYREYTN